jgi:lysyl-tRNA synthetase class 2
MSASRELELDDVHSPHAALSHAQLQGHVLVVGGRLLRDGSRVRLADAFDTLEVELVDGEVAAHASLVVLQGTLSGRTLLAARVLSEQRVASAPTELERLLELGLGRRLQVRARVLAEVRQFFTADGFMEVDTPLRSSECGTETHVEPLSCSGGYLITSPELHMKRLLVGGIPKLFQLAHCFRAGELGPLHSPEFLMLEWYRAFSGWRAMLRDTEQLLFLLCRSVCASASLTLPGGRRIDMTPPFERVSVREAFARFAGVEDASALAERDEDEYFQRLVDDVEPALAAYDKPVFLHDYPRSQAALARLSPEDPSVAERFELYLGGIELCNGYGELNDAEIQRARCELDRERRQELSLHVPDAPERFLTALTQGMPPASGNALGMDRVIALLCGQPRIDAVRPFADDAV